jgi:3',5'-cyclic AMP phosphodiesterase CpdA
MNRTERPDLVVNLGDVVEDESAQADRERYQEFLAILGELQAPVIHVAGNHDQINLTEDELRALWHRTGSLHYSLDVAGVHFSILNTLEEKDVAVRLPEAQIDWLARDLEQASLPVIVLMHHPASDQNLAGNRWFEKTQHICRVAERRRLRRVIEASGKVRAVFNGHVHWNHFDLIGGIPYITVQSLIENLDDDAPGRPARAFAVADLESHRLSVQLHGAETLRYQIDF